MALDIAQLGALAARIGFDLVGRQEEGGKLEPVVFHVGRHEGEYDVTSDTLGAAGVEVPLDVLAFKRKAQQSATLQVNERQFTTDTTTLLVQASQIPAGVTLHETDTVTRADGALWAIVGLGTDPSGATILVDVRK